jgi:hypothetical protein
MFTGQSRLLLFIPDVLILVKAKGKSKKANKAEVRRRKSEVKSPDT